MNDETNSLIRARYEEKTIFLLPTYNGPHLVYLDTNAVTKMFY